METIVTSNDGASFVPAGVYLPRSVRLLSSDPLIDNNFRQTWFGWVDPARVLVEYARIRADLGWRLVAAATTSSVTALRDAGVEHPPSCEWQGSPHRLDPGGASPLPDALDDLHVHRLVLVWPEMYPRLLRIMEADPVFQDRIVRALTAGMLNAATTQAVSIEGGIPDAFRQIWAARVAGHEPNAQQWAAYYAAVPTFNMYTAMERPGSRGDVEPSAQIQQRYRAHWLIARTAEHVGGWANRPLPLPDMCYAAAAVDFDQARAVIEEAVISVEDDLQLGPQ